MQLTVDVEDTLLAKAITLTGIADKGSLVRLALQTLVAKESSKRLAALAGTQPHLEPIPRRR